MYTGDAKGSESGIASAAWVLLGQTGVRGLGLLNTAIAARFVGPDAFGTVALAGMLVALLSTMSSFGFDWALVQRRPSNRELFDAAWTWRVLLGLLVGTLSVIASGQSEQFFNMPGLAVLTCVLAVLPVLGGLENIGLVQLRIQSVFKVEVAVALTCKFITLCVTAWLAYLWRDEWALVAGMILSRILLTVSSYFAHSFRPKFRVSGISQLASFSAWYYIDTLIDFARTRLPLILLGRSYGPSHVGVYQTGAEISYAPLSELIAPLNRIAYVRYTSLQSDRAALRSAFLNTTGATWTVVWPICALTLITADPIVRIVLGPMWSDAAPIIRILAIAAISTSLGSTATYLLMAENRMRTNAARTIVSSVTICTLAWLWIPAYGAIGVAWAVVCGKGITDMWGLVGAARLLPLSPASVIRLGVRPAFATVAATLLTLLLGRNVPWDDGSAMSSLLFLIGATAAYLATYFAALYLAWRLSGREAGVETFVMAKLKDAIRAVGGH